MQLRRKLFKFVNLGTETVLKHAAMATSNGFSCPSDFNGRSDSPTDNTTTSETDDIKLYDITPMDYFSKTQAPLSKSQIFRDELWRRRHTNTTNGSNGKAHGNGHAGGGGGSGSTSASSSTDSVDIETVLTRNMSSDDLKRLIEHQMVEAMKLTRLWTYKESDSNDEAIAEMEEVESVLSKSCASLDVSVRRTAEFSATKRRRTKSTKIAKAKNTRRISL